MQKVSAKDPKRRVKYVRADRPGKMKSAGRKNSKKKRIRNYIVVSLTAVAVLALVIWLAEIDWDEIINRE